MKFDNIELASGISGARDGQGLKRNVAYYVSAGAGSKYAIGTADSDDTIDEDYYLVYNKWPTLTGAVSDASEVVYSGTALNDIGISSLWIQAGATATGSQELDVAIIRKSDRKAVRLSVTGLSGTAAKNALRGPAVGVTGVTVAAIDPKDGPRTPETGRLTLLGYA
jgi:hypothetical protein